MKTGEPGGQEGLLSLAQQPHHLLLSIIDGPAGKGVLPGSGEGMLEAEAVMSPPESPIRSHACMWKPAGSSLLHTTPLHPRAACLSQWKPTGLTSLTARAGCQAGFQQWAGLASVPPVHLPDPQPTTKSTQHCSLGRRTFVKVSVLHQDRWYLPPPPSGT